MSEIINNSRERIEALADFSRNLMNGENGKMLVAKYKGIIDTVTPAETMQVLDKMLLEGFSHGTVKANVGKIINVFYTSLGSFQWNKPGEGHFLYYMMLENREVKKLMTELRSVFKIYFKAESHDIPVLTMKLRMLIGKLKGYELHYIKKENILFPYIEKAFPQYRCLQLMWSFHDDFRASLKILDRILQSAPPNKELLNKETGKLFFVVLPIIFREEQIVFPVALSAIAEKAWTEMLEQSYDIGWCFIKQPDREFARSQETLNSEGKINMGTGFLTPEQLVLLLNNLTVDITFIDENDEVKYFSTPADRIFPRSKAIIGRKVQNCHPPGSVHIVNEIIAAFRDGRKDHADFWIQMKGRFLNIRYFALRDELGDYKGTIEVSQDVTEIRSLQGERRLLEWNE